MFLQDLAVFQAAFPVVVAAMAFIIGATVGSFLNVVIYRLPIMMQRDWQYQATEILTETLSNDSLTQSLQDELPDDKPFNLFTPASRCPACDTGIKPWHNIPIFGWLFLKGSCANCDANISARYPIVEFISALLTTFIIVHFGVGWLAFAACLLTWALISLALIDYDTQLLPDDITLPFMWLGLVVNYFGVVTTFSNAFLGACAGYLVLWIVFQLFKLITGKDGMGYGDFKMLAMLGAWLGIAQLPVIILISSFAGAVLGGLAIAFGRDKAKPIKFGPFLAVAGFIALIWGTDLTLWYFEIMNPEIT